MKKSKFLICLPIIFSYFASATVFDGEFKGPKFENMYAALEVVPVAEGTEPEVPGDDQQPEPETEIPNPEEGAANQEDETSNPKDEEANPEAETAGGSQEPDQQAEAAQEEAPAEPEVEPDPAAEVANEREGLAPGDESSDQGAEDPAAVEAESVAGALQEEGAESVTGEPDQQAEAAQEEAPAEPEVEPDPAAEVANEQEGLAPGDESSDQGAEVPAAEGTESVAGEPNPAEATAEEDNVLVAEEPDQQAEAAQAEVPAVQPVLEVAEGEQEGLAPEVSNQGAEVPEPEAEAQGVPTDNPVQGMEATQTAEQPLSPDPEETTDQGRAIVPETGSESMVDGEVNPKPDALQEQETVEPKGETGVTDGGEEQGPADVPHQTSEGGTKDASPEVEVRQPPEATVSEPAEVVEQAEGGSEEDAEPDKLISVFRYNVQDCGQPVTEPWEMQTVLNENGIDVFSSLRGFDGFTYSISDLMESGKGCVDQIPQINIFSIRADQYTTAEQLGFRKCSDLKKDGGQCYPMSLSKQMYMDSEINRVHVYKTASQRLCDVRSGIDIQEMEQELLEQDVAVHRRYTAVNGLKHYVDCDQLTPLINVYVIDMEKLGSAIAHGFRECAWLVKQGGGCISESARR